MAFSGEPVPLRDDQSVRSMSVNEREFASSCLRKSDALLRTVDDSSSSSGNVGLRSDGRRADEFRGPLSLSLGRSHGASTCTVRLGPRGTRAACACACELVPPPHPDRPDDGALRIRVSASPASAPGVVDPSSEDHFGGGGGGDRDGDEVRKRDRVRRLLERTLLRGGAIDTEALCVRSGEWVWRVSVDAVLLDDVGNATDAIGLAVSAALRHLRLPCVDDDDNDGGGVTILRDDDREPTPLPLHHTPAYVSFALFGGGDGDGADATVAVVDPDDREELLADCPSATFAFHRHGELCSTDFPGGREIPPRGLTRLARVARATAKGLCDALEEALRDADLRAAEDRRRRLRGNAPPTAEAAEPGAAYHEEGTPEVASSSGRSDEERYRAEALDYANTHRAARVRETTNDDRETDRASRTASSSSSLVEAMRRTAGVPRGLPPTVDPSGAPPPPLFDEGAREEFEAYAEQAVAAAEKAVVADADDDDDDEEPVTTVLRGEFDDLARRADAAEKGTVATNERDGARNATTTAKVVDENATDLAAAIIQRKGGGGTKKKKKKKTKKGEANSGG